MKEIVRRLRDQANAPGHVWHEIQILLLEAANEIEHMSKLYWEVANEYDDFRINLKYSEECKKAAAKPLCKFDERAAEGYGMNERSTSKGVC